jgi:RNA polymerase sigma-70 factor (ECF subfamily)
VQHAFVAPDPTADPPPEPPRDHPTTPPPDLGRLRDAYQRTHARLWRSVFAWSESRDVADEACAEAFAQAARRGNAVRDIDAWVWRAAFRIAAGELKRRRGGTRATDGTVVDRSLDVGELAGRLSDPTIDPDLPAAAVDLVRALGRLSEQQRACVVLRDLAGFSAAEAAAALATSAATVRVQAMRGRRRLRELLGDEPTDTFTAGDGDHA